MPRCRHVARLLAGGHLVAGTHGYLASPGQPWPLFSLLSLCSLSFSPPLPLFEIALVKLLSWLLGSVAVVSSYVRYLLSLGSQNLKENKRRLVRILALPLKAPNEGSLVWRTQNPHPEVTQVSDTRMGSQLGVFSPVLGILEREGCAPLE